MHTERSDFIKIKGKFMIIASSLFILTVIFGIYISDWKNPEDIISIEIETEDPLFMEHDGYIIDFSRNTFTHNDFKSDLEKITAISDDDKKDFVRKTNICGFFGWKECYEPIWENECGGSYSDFLITYTDGSQQKIYCSDEYPITYYKFWDAVRNTFGDCLVQEDDYEN